MLSQSISSPSFTHTYRVLGGRLTTSCAVKPRAPSLPSPCLCPCCCNQHPTTSERGVESAPVRAPEAALFHRGRRRSRRVHFRFEHQTLRIYEQMTLSSLHLLA